MSHRLAASSGRHHFFPSRSFNPALSSIASANSRFSLAFSAAQPRSRKRQAEAAVGRRDAGQCRVEGPARKKMVTPAACREAVAHLRSGFAMSERRACRVAEVERSSVRYRRRRPDDALVRERLKALAAQRRRFGYRRLWVLLRREGHAVNKKRVYRLYRQERLMVRRRGGRKRAVGTRAPMPVPSGPNRRWSLDFVHD